MKLKLVDGGIAKRMNNQITCDLVSTRTRSIGALCPRTTVRAAYNTGFGSYGSLWSGEET